MKFILILSFFSFSIAQAQVGAEHVDTMIQQMIEKNLLKPSEAEAAKAQLKAITPEQWKQINGYAQDLMKKAPASQKGKSQNNIEEIHGLDLDSPEFKKMQQDIGGILK